MTAEHSRGVVDLGRPWSGVGPFLFTAYHLDAYPAGTDDQGPDPELLRGRPMGSDFGHPSGWSMYHGSVVPGFPGHPHRGFETITVVRQGVVDHADSTGAGARYSAGDVQWVTAGNGVSHSEMFPLVSTDSDNPFELYQLWLNLPARSKSADPEFAMYWREQIPVVTPDDATGDARVTVIAGAFDGVAPQNPPSASWAAEADNDVAVWLVDLGPQSSLRLPATNSPRTERMLYVHGENAQVTIDGAEVSAGQGFSQNDQGDLVLQTAESSATVLVLQGVPIGEPVVAHGPFVMNSAAEIEQAFADYQRTRFGGWPWNSDAPVYPRETPRFAAHGDGTTEYPDGVVPESVPTPVA